MKKYYAYFWFDDREYVIRFQIKGSLQWDEKYQCFKDSRWYVRTIGEIISHLVFETHQSNLRGRFGAMKISHKAFKEERAKGTCRWPNSVLVWEL